jgi:hypothetical protein
MMVLLSVSMGGFSVTSTFILASIETGTSPLVPQAPLSVSTIRTNTNCAHLSHVEFGAAYQLVCAMMTAIEIFYGGKISCAHCFVWFRVASGFCHTYDLANIWTIEYIRT